jgi:formate hydrogenlyase subunit 3/multisubunit Na+/H+ antiporter MnhD subunit
MSSALLVAAVGWPVALAAGLAVPGVRKMARALAPWAALPGLLAGLLGTDEYALGWLMFGGWLGLDRIAAIMLPVTAGLWLAAGIFAQHYLERGPRRDAFFGWFLAALAGNLLLLVALDAVVFYLGFAVMSFASYGLVVHEGSARAGHAGRYYIALVVAGEVCVISALMLLASQGATDFVSLRMVLLTDHLGRNDLIVGLLLAGFGIKVGLFGLHFWLPLAHPVAPAPASAVLSGAMIKAGLVAWMRLLPLGEIALPTWGAALAGLGLFTAYYGVLAGLGQREPKAVLAYSSVSQMGVMTVGIGLGLAYPAEWPSLFAALLIYMAHHCLVKGGLFLGAGLASHPLSTASARALMVIAGLAALAIAGGPLTGGLVAKLALKHAASPAWSGMLLPLLSLSSVLTALLMLRFLGLVQPSVTLDAGRPAVGLVAPWLALGAAWLSVPWALAPPALRAEAVASGAAWTGAWPVALAGGIAWLVLRGIRAGRLPAIPRVPPGDLGIPLERALLRLGRATRKLLGERLPQALDGAKGRIRPAAHRRAGWSDRLGAGEAHLAAWSVTGVMVVLLAISLAWLLS